MATSTSSSSEAHPGCRSGKSLRPRWLTVASGTACPWRTSTIPSGTSSSPSRTVCVARVGAQAGARAIGATLYEVAAGGPISPYHLHHANEELLIVLDGRPRLRTPEGTTTLEPGSVVAFPLGEEGAHRISNAGPEPARVLVCSTMKVPEVAEYPDTGTWLAMIGPSEGKVFRAGADVAIAKAMVQAMEEGAAREGE